MRPSIRFALALSIAISPLVASGATLNASLEGRPLRVLVPADTPPEVFRLSGDGEPGLEREMISAFARMHGLQLSFVRVRNLDRMIPALLTGEGDVAVGIIDTDVRRNFVSFTTETLPARHVLVTRQPRAAATDLTALKSLRVGVVGGTWWDEVARKQGIPESQIHTVQTTAELLQELAAARVDASVMSVADLLFERRRDPHLVAGALVGPPLRAAWAVRKDDNRLLSPLNAFLETLRGSPAWSRLVLKYFNEDGLAVLARARRE